MALAVARVLAVSGRKVHGKVAARIELEAALEAVRGETLEEVRRRLRDEAVR